MTKACSRASLVDILSMMWVKLNRPTTGLSIRSLGSERSQSVEFVIVRVWQVYRLESINNRSLSYLGWIAGLADGGQIPQFPDSFTWCQKRGGSCKAIISRSRASHS